MIPNILSSSVSFASNKRNPVRDLYDAHLNATNKTAQNQKTIMTAPAAPISTLNAPIPMQGTGQKLNVIV